MKKILIATNALLTVFIFLYACNSEKQPAKIEGDDPVKMEIGKIPSDSCAPKFTRDYSDPEANGSIDAFLAKRISEDYKADPFKGFVSRESLGAANKKNPDALCIWFELGKIKNLISMIENSVCAKNCDNPLNLGIRIYYAKYPSVTGPDAAHEDMRRLPTNYAGRHTVFLVGTYDNRKGEHVDFDPMNVGDKCAPTPYKTLLALRDGRKFKITSAGKKLNAAVLRDTTVNHGDLTPPPAGSGTFPIGEN